MEALLVLSHVQLRDVFGPVLPSDGCGRLDFGGKDLPEPPLQLLHVGRFGSSQVEASSSFLPVTPSQRSDHLKDNTTRVFLHLCW